ncbi:MAG TPA: carbohydrate-binding protein [Limnochordia bacterium]|nr:carbohydrate-binding protein [Limnochordia bacterium]
MRLPTEMIRRALGLASNREAMEVARELAPQLSVDAGSQGVEAPKDPIRRGGRFQIAYSGLLHRSGATSLYLHCGYGPGAWQAVRDLPMQRTGDAWRAELSAEAGGEFAFCFHDGANHWDNNHGNDWHLPIR